MLHPMICGKWDGCHVWLQWTGAGDALSYEVELSLRLPDSSDWLPFTRVIPPQGERSDWGVVPTWKEDWFCRARVRAILETGPTDWEYAVEVTFTCSRCLFEISSRHEVKLYPRGTSFHAVVDGAACVYLLLDELVVPVGRSVEVELASPLASGWHQLDRPDHFRIQPAYGVTVRNLAPSVDDVTPTGRDFTCIEADRSSILSFAVHEKSAF